VSFRDNISDSALLIRLADDDHSAFTQIYQRYKGALFIHAYKILKDEDEAKDVVQELFTTLWVKREEINLTSTLASYLFASVRNRVLDIIAHRTVKGKYIDSLAEFIEKGEWITDQQVREKELSELIEKEIALLPAKMRQVFELNRFKQYSYNEIAQELQISDKTVKKQIHNALQILRRKLDFAILSWFF
jgi:RNA polymerase sigma-70 factor (ECF subfamily)